MPGRSRPVSLSPCGQGAHGLFLAALQSPAQLQAWVKREPLYNLGVDPGLCFASVASRGQHAPTAGLWSGCRQARSAETEKAGLWHSSLSPPPLGSRELNTWGAFPGRTLLLLPLSAGALPPPLSWSQARMRIGRKGWGGWSRCPEPQAVTKDPSQAASTTRPPWTPSIVP